MFLSLQALIDILAEESYKMAIVYPYGVKETPLFRIESEDAESLIANLERRLSAFEEGNFTVELRTSAKNTSDAVRRNVQLKKTANAANPYAIGAPAMPVIDKSELKELREEIASMREEFYDTEQEEIEAEREEEINDLKKSISLLTEHVKNTNQWQAKIAEQLVPFIPSIIDKLGIGRLLGGPAQPAIGSPKTQETVVMENDSTPSATEVPDRSRLTAAINKALQVHGFDKILELTEVLANAAPEKLVSLEKMVKAFLT